MKELFWVGTKDTKGFQSQKELREAINDIALLGWTVVDLKTAKKFNQPSNWDIPGVIMNNQYGINPMMNKISLAELNDEYYNTFIDRSNVLELQNPNSGILVYETRPYPSWQPIIVPLDNNTEAKIYLDSLHRNKCNISINDHEYSLNPKTNEKPVNEDDLVFIQDKKYISNASLTPSLETTSKKPINSSDEFDFKIVLTILFLILCIMVIYCISNISKISTKVDSIVKYLEIDI